MILDDIIAYKRQLLAERKRTYPLSFLQKRIAGQDPALDFTGVLSHPGVNLIAEVKRASPSRGLLCSDFDPVRLARVYTDNGAVAISVLTEERFFQGRLEYLEEIRQELEQETEAGNASPKPVPLLQKDFIFDPYQLYEARAWGADAVLLIVAILSSAELAELLALAREVGMAALVEVHDASELERALSANATLIGINNRDLRTFQVDVNTTLRLASLIPDEVLVVSESGIQSPEDVLRLGEAGVDAILIGEALVTAPDVGAKTWELASAGRRVNDRKRGTDGKSENLRHH